MGFLETLDRIGLKLETIINRLGGELLNSGPQPKEEKMCGSLKHSQWTTKAPLKVGDTFPAETSVYVEKDGKLVQVSGQVVWNGFAQSEKMDGWIKGGWTPACLEVDGFTEGDRDFNVPWGRVIKAVILERDKNYLNIVTRAAETEEEKCIHGRWPLVEERSVPRTSKARED